MEKSLYYQIVKHLPDNFNELSFSAKEYIMNKIMEKINEKKYMKIVIFLN